MTHERQGAYSAMNDPLRNVEAKLAYDRGSPRAEWTAVEELLVQFPMEREAITQWLFEHHRGYVDTRVRAGLELMKHQPTDGWRILEHLISSKDPDDRDTALAVLEIQDHKDAARMAFPLLDDEWPYIKLEAAAFIGRFFPHEAHECLTRLLYHESVSVRERAQSLLTATESTNDETSLPP